MAVEKVGCVEYIDLKVVITMFKDIDVGSLSLIPTYHIQEDE